MCVYQLPFYRSRLYKNKTRASLEDHRRRGPRWPHTHTHTQTGLVSRNVHRSSPPCLEVHYASFERVTTVSPRTHNSVQRFFRADASNFQVKLKHEERWLVGSGCARGSAESGTSHPVHERFYSTVRERTPFIYPSCF